MTDSIVVTNDDRIAAARRWIEEGRNDIEQFKGSYNDAQPSSPTASADAASKAIDEHQAQNNADIEAGIARANDTFQQALASFVGAIQVYYTALARTYNDNKNVRDRAEEAAQKNTDSSTQKLDQINFGTANSRLNELDSLLAKVKNERNEIGARIVRNLPIVPARYDRFKSSPTSYIGQQIRQNLINIESMRKAASSLTVEQNDYLAKADNLLHIVDLEGGSTPDHDLNNRIIVARQLIDLAAGRNVDWKADSAKKIECEGKTISERDRNRLRTSEYAKLYISDPDSFKWPGMAAYASDLVGFGIDVGGFLKHYPDYAGVVQETGKFMAEGNAAVFNDIYWQFDAYSAGGIEEIKRLAEVQELTDDQLKAWLVIDDGRKTGDQEQVWLGNELLLRYEQFVTLQPIYKQYSDLSLLLSPFMISPIPGDMEIFQIEVPGGNVGNRDDRWSWITKSMLPAYRKLSDQNRNKATSDLSNLIIDSAGVCK
ncbi:MAG: hypothetical protein NTX25_04585 [Proteobacteria bacterium]|nr:hypothetical protein [Pseudomonadota bacterium]